MPGYIIVFREKTTNPASMKAYSVKARASMTPDLKVLAAHGAIEAVEGETPETVVLMRFPSVAAARAWYYSDAYQEALPLRKAGSTNRAVIFEGLDDPAG